MPFFTVCLHLHLITFPFSLRPWSAGNKLSHFPFSESVFTLPLFYYLGKYVFRGLKLFVDSVIFSVNTLKLWFHSLLTFDVWWKVSSYSHLGSPICYMSFFSLRLLCLIFSGLSMKCLDVFFMLTCSGAIELTESVGWCFWPNLVTSQLAYLQILFLSPFISSVFLGLRLCILGLSPVPQFIENQFISFQIAFLCALL